MAGKNLLHCSYSIQQCSLLRQTPINKKGYLATGRFSGTPNLAVKSHYPFPGKNTNKKGAQF